MRKKDNKKLIIIAAGLLILILIAVGIFALWLNRTINTKNSTDSSTQEFVIESGEGSGDIAQRLEGQKLIKSSFAFVFYLNLKRVGDNVQIGEYRIRKDLSIVEVAEILTKGKIQTNKITVPEGWDLAKIGAMLETKKITTKEAFLAQARIENYRAKYAFLKDAPDNISLEGYLYPDTYQLSKGAGPDEVITKMLDNFGRKIKPFESKVTSKMSLYEVVNLASVVEREVAKADDRKLVASVFLNRLEIGMPLESCATIQYILKENKKQFTIAETRTPSPYNTYLNRGLPAGPIGNPSIQSIVAVLEPQDSNYLYFLSSEGVTYFSKTLDEHNAKKAKYLY